MKKNKDWDGNSNSVYKILSASNHTDENRSNNDYYATDPKAVRFLLNMETFNHKVWEVACGEGHLSKVLEEFGYEVRSSDLIDRNYGESGVNFLEYDKKWEGDIITNPPYAFAKEFIEKSLEIIPDGNKVAMFLKIQFLEGKARKKLFEKHPPKIVYVSSSRLLCAKNGNFVEAEKVGSAVAYCWYVWKKGFSGDPIIKWFN